MEDSFELKFLNKVFFCQFQTDKYNHQIQKGHFSLHDWRPATQAINKCCRHEDVPTVFGKCRPWMSQNAFSLHNYKQALTSFCMYSNLHRCKIITKGNRRSHTDSTCLRTQSRKGKPIIELVLLQILMTSINYTQQIVSLVSKKSYNCP